MQPNQPYPPAQDPDPADEPFVNQPATPWSATPQPQQAAPQQPITQPTPAPDFARYQPQPVQTPPTVPAPAPQTTNNDYTQPIAQPQPAQAQPVAQPTYAQQPAPQQQAQPQADTLPAAPLQQPATPAPLSPFEQNYQAALQTPPRKKSRIGLIIAGIIAAVLLLGGGATAYMWMQDQNDPTKRFYRAIESHLSTTLIQQDYKQELQMGTKIEATMDATSDFTDPKTAKSYIKYDINSEEAAFDSTGEVVVLDDKEYFAKLTQSRNFEGMGSEYLPVINQWYRVDKDDFGGTMLLDPGSVAGHINTPTGEVLVGNFDENTRKDLMTFIKDKSVYTIKSSKDVTVDGQKMTEYDFAFNMDALNELNKKAVKALGLPDDTYEDQAPKDGQKNTLWINHKTGRIAKAQVTRETDSAGADKKTKETSTITISYPTSASSIAKPEGAKDVPWKSL